MFRPELAGRMIGASLLTNLVTGVIRARKAQYILPWRSYCPGHSRQRSGSAGAWTVPPGGSRFHQLALPFEERGAGGGMNMLFKITAIFSLLMVLPVL